MANSAPPRVTGSARWVLLEKLGEGGQGIVHAAIPLDTAIARDDLLGRVTKLLSAVASEMGRDDESRKQAARSILDISAEWSPDWRLSAAAAFKEYKIPSGPNGEKPRQRLAAEVQALQGLRGNPAVLQLLDSDTQQGWIVTELHRKRALDHHPTLFKGRALEALQALRPVVAAVARLHGSGVVHRDIKTPNIFVADDGRLVLGDFGIVFFEDRAKSRVTESLEKVGSRDWMPPWTHTGGRLDTVPPNFDVFALGKVLWTMISGRPMLPYWYWDRPENNLAVLFANRPEMGLINDLVLKNSVVEDASQCVPSGAELLDAFDGAIAAIEVGGGPVGRNVKRRCRICGIGTYEPLWNQDTRILLFTHTTQGLHMADRLFKEANALTIKVLSCKECGHLEFFHFPKGSAPKRWWP